MTDALTIVFQDRWLVVVDKPAGIPTTGRTLDDPHCIQAQLCRGFGQMVWAVHQLDAGTTGLNLFVRRKSAVAVFTDKLKKGEKHYLAVVSGAPAWDHKHIEAAIGYDEESRSWGLLESGKPALSVARVLARGSLVGTDADSAGGLRASLVTVRIHTGRTHQVRLHLASVGHPLIGDPRYGDPENPTGFERPALHAFRVRLPGIPDLEAPPPPDFRELCARFALALPVPEPAA